VKFSVKWLQEFIPIDVPVERLAELLSHSGSKVESIDKPAKEIGGVVVSEVLDITPHPDADNLTLVEVKVDGRTTQRVVCGAQNFSVGDRVPLAQVGARLSGMEVKERTIRGQPSRGMLCSPAELGVSRDNSGILVLPPDAALGEDVSALLGLDDTIIELEVTPNRGDCMGMVGIAREVAALLGHELKIPDWDAAAQENVENPLTVDIRDPKGCSRFAARYVSGVSSAPSPVWMQSRLLALGVRPISNIVDVSNYVMLETGHPSHAFDAARIDGATLIVRRAADGEELTTLDGQPRRLHPDDLVVADPDRALGIAGVMGGLDSEVSNETTDVVVEAARWDPASIAYTTRRHLLRTEASARFERGADPEMPPVAAARAAHLIAELAGGSVAARVVDEYPTPWRPARITLRPARTNAVLGFAVPADAQASHLKSVGFHVAETDGTIDATVPSFRSEDVTREIDLIEEVARLAGFNRLPVTLPPGRAGALEPEQAAERRMRRVLTGLGMAEAWTSSFGSQAELDALGIERDHPARRMVQVANPTSDDEPALRTTLLPGLLRSAARNVAQHASSIALYEIARTYEPSTSILPRETLAAGGVFSGTRGGTSWRKAPEPWDFFGAKGVLEKAVEAMEIDGLGFAPAKTMPFHPARAASVALGATSIGLLGELHPVVCDRFSVPEGTVAFELSLVRLFARLPERVKVEELSRFPAVYVDLAVVVGDGVPAARVEDVIREAGAPEVVGTRLFDVYKGEQVPRGHKSLAYALELRSRERTLKDEDVQIVLRRILSSLEERTGARLRT
jgi:phenylalanyl-tRNA synthetase beta chain